MKSYVGVETLLCWAIVAAAASSSFGRETMKDYSPFPKPDVGYVTDLADVLSSEQEEELERTLGETENKYGVEIAVVTIRSMADYPGAPNGGVEAFARALFDAYGIGNMPKNKGVLLLVAVQDRKARIELGAGYGHRKDKVAVHIMDRKIVPRFRKEQYGRGVVEGTKAIAGAFGHRSSIAYRIFSVIVIIIACPVILFLVVIVYGLLGLTDSGSSGSSNKSDDGFGGGFSGGGGATGSW